MAFDGKDFHLFSISPNKGRSFRPDLMALFD